MVDGILLSVLWRCQPTCCLLAFMVSDEEFYWRFPFQDEFLVFGWFQDFFLVFAFWHFVSDVSRFGSFLVYPFWMCRGMFFIKFLKFLSNIFSNFFCVAFSFSTSSPYVTSILHILVWLMVFKRVWSSVHFSSLVIILFHREDNFN